MPTPDRDRSGQRESRWEAGECMKKSLESTGKDYRKIYNFGNLENVLLDSAIPRSGPGLLKTAPQSSSSWFSLSLWFSRGAWPNAIPSKILGCTILRRRSASASATMPSRGDGCLSAELRLRLRLGASFSSHHSNRRFIVLRLPSRSRPWLRSRSRFLRHDWNPLPLLI